jgi:thiamine-phosphate pyrophosphorylase
MDEEIYRIIDANLNRAREGLRVGEEISRFLLNDPALTSEFKKTRHSLRKILEKFPEQLKNKLLEERDSLKDVGLLVKEEGKKRGNFKEIIKANLRRTQEATRVLEEFSGLLNPQLGSKFEKVRFKVYSLEKEIISRTFSPPFPGSGLYVILSGELLGERTYQEVTREVIGAGARVIQLREKEKPTRTFLKIARDLRKITREKKAVFIINDRVDIALSCEAEGVHLGQEDLPLEKARKLMGRNKIIGISTHNLKEALRAERGGADYIGVGPIFATPTKNYLPRGLNLISRVKGKVKIPFVALGGIKENNIKEVKKAGAKCIALSSAILKAPNIKKATQKLINKIKIPPPISSPLKGED